MVEVEAGKVYNTTEKKCGMGKNGEYMMFIVKAEKGYDKITVWAAEGTITKDLKSADAAKVKTIRKVRKSARQFNGKWMENYDVIADLEPVTVKNTDVAFNEFMAGPSDKDIEDLFFGSGNDAPPFNF